MFPATVSNHLTAVPHQIGDVERRSRFGHDGAVFWLTGLSASGKSTLAMGLEKRLLALGYACYTLDGDNMRNSLNANLGFSPDDRRENVRRIGAVAALFADAGLICITACISPYRVDRAQARTVAGGTHFHEVYLAADLGTCEARDPKGLYRKARLGILPNFTGIEAPYEVPDFPELTIDTAAETVNKSLQRLVDYAVSNVPLAQQASRLTESSLI